MTTQPSDWAVARALERLSARRDWGYGRLRSPVILIAEVMELARELDASGGGQVSTLNSNGISELHANIEPQLATPRAAEAGTTNSAQISSSLVVGAQAPAAGVTDRQRLDWLCSGERKMVEDTIDSGWFRVYRDVADVAAEHAKWRAMTDDFYPSHREAIDAAMGAVGAGGGDHG